MSLEAKIDTLTAAVVALTAQVQFQNDRLSPTTVQAANTMPVAAVAQAPIPAPVQAAPAPVAAAPEVPAFAAPVAAAPAMPPTPSFAAPVAPAPVATVPFSDGKGLIEFVMNAYKELNAISPEKGQQIQNVLTSLSYANVNDVKPEHYPAFYAGVQALKAA